MQTVDNFISRLPRRERAGSAAVKRRKNDEKSHRFPHRIFNKIFT